MSTREISLLSPAKVNLTLAITGVREDGFHDLVSLVAPIDFGDTVTTRLDPEAREDTLHCDFPDVPTDASNLALRAVAAFRTRHAFEGGVHVDLAKRIPAGAGLGGGSSNASTVLLALNELCGHPLADDELVALSATLGSDCPLFLAREPVIMRGRGERVDRLPTAAREALRGRELLVFKPDFGVSTGWAYGRMKEARAWYCPPETAEAMLAKWLEAPEGVELPLFNNMQGPAFEKYLALPCALEAIRERHGLPCLMSGSGSACFAMLAGEAADDEVAETVRECLGQDCCVEFARLL